jgi:hypothetical protein
LEDYAGERKPTNVELVERAAGLIERGGRRVAIPRETQDLLRIPRRGATESSAGGQSHEP